MMIKLQDLYCYFLQAFAVRSCGWNDCHKQPGSMVWLPRAAAVIVRLGRSWIVFLVVVAVVLGLKDCHHAGADWEAAFGPFRGCLRAAEDERD